MSIRMNIFTLGNTMIPIHITDLDLDLDIPFELGDQISHGLVAVRTKADHVPHVVGLAVVAGTPNKSIRVVLLFCLRG